MSGQTETSQGYEDRIAALEAKIAALEVEVETKAVQSDWNWTGWAERYGLILAWIAIILVLGAFKPNQMFAWNSYASMLGSNAMVVVLTLALIIPLTTGDFDLSVASVMGLSSMLIAKGSRTTWSSSASPPRATTSTTPGCSTPAAASGPSWRPPRRPSRHC